jgi:hypothetical protein
MTDRIPEEAKNFKLLGHDPSAAWGGGSIVEIHKGFAYVGAVGSASFNGPEGFTVHDVRDPRKPKKVAIDDAELVRVHAGRRLHLGDLARLSRIAHVMDGETFGAVEACRADRADIGEALVNLDDRATAPGRRRIVAEQLEILGFFGDSIRHFTLPSQAVSRSSCPALGSGLWPAQGQALVPGIHVFLVIALSKTWMAGTSPAMTLMVFRIYVGRYRPPIATLLTPSPGNSHTPAPPGF